MNPFYITNTRYNELISLWVFVISRNYCNYLIFIYIFIYVFVQTVSSSAMSTPTNNHTVPRTNNSQTVPTKQEYVEKPQYRTASPAKAVSRVAAISRDDYASPMNRTPLSSNGRQDTYGEAAASYDRPSVANKLSYSSPSDSSSIPSSRAMSTPETPYGYNTHYNAENSPMWLSSTKDMSNYNPKQYEDSLIDSTRNLSFNSPVNRIADGAEQPDGSGMFTFCYFNSTNYSLLFVRATAVDCIS